MHLILGANILFIACALNLSARDNEGSSIVTLYTSGHFTDTYSSSS